MSLIRGVWNINANGFEGQLNIASVDAQGNLNGTVFGNPIRGFWDENAQKITFLRVINAADPTTLQVFTGFRFQNPQNPEPGRNVTHTLAVFFEAFSGTGATAQRSLFGWFAQVVVVG